MITITVEDVQTYLKLDYLSDVDLEDVENIFIPVAVDYVRDGVTDFDSKIGNPKFYNRAKLLALVVIQELYENRMFIDNRKREPSFTVQSLFRQLNYGDFND